MQEFGSAGNERNYQDFKVAKILGVKSVTFKNHVGVKNNDASYVPQTLPDGRGSHSAL
jgi:hypothetical protein